MDVFWSIVVVVAIIAAVRFALFPALVFKISVSNGSARLVKGKLSQGLVQEIRDICRERGIARGWIGGVRRGRAVTLVFSRSVPADCRQQLRNLWVNS